MNSVDEAAEYDHDELNRKADEILELAMQATFDGDGGTDRTRRDDAYAHATDSGCGMSDGGYDTYEIYDGLSDSEKEAAKDQVYRYYQGITDEIKRRSDPSPRALEGLVDRCNRALADLGYPDYTQMVSYDHDADATAAEQDRVIVNDEESPAAANSEYSSDLAAQGHANDILVHWRGEYGSNLSRYLREVEIVRHNNANVIRVLASATQAVAMVNRVKRKELTSIIDNARDSLRDLRFDSPFESGGGYEPAIWAASSTITLLGLLDPEPATRTALTLTGIALSGASQFYTDESDETNNLLAHTPAHVMAKMRTAINGVHDRYEASLETVHDHLKEQAAIIDRVADTGADGNDFIAMRPRITEAMADIANGDFQTIYDRMYL